MSEIIITLESSSGHVAPPPDGLYRVRYLGAVLSMLDLSIYSVAYVLNSVILIVSALYSRGWLKYISRYQVKTWKTCLLFEFTSGMLCILSSCLLNSRFLSGGLILKWQLGLVIIPRDSRKDTSLTMFQVLSNQYLHFVLKTNCCALLIIGLIPTEAQTYQWLPTL